MVTSVRSFVHCLLIFVRSFVYCLFVCLFLFVHSFNVRVLVLVRSFVRLFDLSFPVELVVSGQQLSVPSTLPFAPIHIAFGYLSFALFQIAFLTPLVLSDVLDRLF